MSTKYHSGCSIISVIAIVVIILTDRVLTILSLNSNILSIIRERILMKKLPLIWWILLLVLSPESVLEVRDGSLIGFGVGLVGVEFLMRGRFDKEIF